MQITKNPQDEILVLENEVNHFKRLLDESISNDEIFEKTRVIFHDLKILTERLAELKRTVVLKKI
jgi:hypothetical protein